MGLLSFFHSYNINEGVENFKLTKGAVLLDVRTINEYKEGHIPNSLNVPLDTINKVSKKIKDKDIPIFIYCYSGSRSKRATSLLKKMGYQNITNIGGIANYHGKVEK